MRPNIVRSLNGFVIGVNLLAGAYDVGIGLLDIVHHHYLMAAFMFVAATFVLGFQWWWWRERKRRVRRMAKLTRGVNAMEAAQAAALRLMEESVAEPPPPDATEKARLNLRTVMRATGAQFSGGSVVLVVKGLTFWIDGGHIHCLSNRTQTCYQVVTPMPPEEKIATALLLLHDDPRIYKLWRDRPGHWYGHA